MRKCVFILLAIISFLPSNSQNTQPLFTLLNANKTGIDFKNEIKEDEGLNVLAYEYFYNGGGVAIGDVNNDGLPDVFFTANIKSNRLFLNKGNFQFRDITRQAKLSGKKSWKTGVTMADVNGDGWLDIYVCYSGKGDSSSRANELYINNQDLSFTERAKEFGLDDKGCSTQAVFFDYDNDGDLDCYVLNHNIKVFKNIGLQHLKSDFDYLSADRLYKNENGKFTDVSKAAGITGNPISFGLGVAVSDINNDGWPDIYVSNDYMEQDYCFMNNADGTFSQKEMYMFGHLSQFSMGSDIADFNNDGLVDIFTLDMMPEDNRRQKLLQAQENYELYQEMAANGFHYQFMRNMLHLNNGNGTFSEIGQLAGISNTDWSWAPLVADFDNDGNKDLIVTNGYMRDYTNKDFLKYWGDYLVKQVANRDSINYMEIIKMMPVTFLSNYAFKNNGNLRFSNITAEWGLKQPALSAGAAYGDLDNDGDLDLVISNTNENAFVYRNESNRNHYLDIRLEGGAKNRNGIGARLYCYTNGNVQMLEQMPTRGYQSSVSEILHFGTGENALIDSLRVLWPDGKTQTLANIKVDTLIVLAHHNARNVGNSGPVIGEKLFSYRKPITEFSHLQLEYNDFKRQPLMPVMYSHSGPRIAAADLDADGLDDLFIASSQGQGSVLYLQREGVLKESSQGVFHADSIANTTSIAVFDADGDNDLDIYCSSGGYNDYQENDRRLQDRLFLNDGKGHFSLAENALPPMYSSKSVAAPADIDGDGDIDLFVAGRVVPGKYPIAPRSYFLQNDGKGIFTDVTNQWCPELSSAGMITDAKWTDINNDGKADLLIAGEWMAPALYENTKQGLIRKEAFEHTNFTGWWNTIELFDFDNDGDEDFIAGNWGLNSQLRASTDEPLEMFYADFDNNGSIDPFLCCYIQGKSYPYITRDELLDQMYPLRRKFTSYKSYANATMHDIFTVQEMERSKRLHASHLSTTLFENRQGKYFEKQLPVQSQFSPVYKIIVEDLDMDGFIDLVLLGNNDYPRLKIGKMDANFGTVLLNNGGREFIFATPAETGFLIAGDVKDAAIISINGSRLLLTGINNAGLINYKFNK